MLETIESLESAPNTRVRWRLPLIALFAATAFAAKNPPQEYPTFRVVPGSCDTVWPIAIQKFTQAGLVPQSSDKAGGVLALFWRKGESAGFAANKDVLAFTKASRGAFTSFDRLRIDNSSAVFTAEGNGCRVQITISYAAWKRSLLQVGWVAVDSSGLFESRLLDGIEPVREAPAPVSDKSGTPAPAQTTTNSDAAEPQQASTAPTASKNPPPQPDTPRSPAGQAQQAGSGANSANAEARPSGASVRPVAPQPRPRLEVAVVNSTPVIPKSATQQVQVKQVAEPESMAVPTAYQTKQAGMAQQPNPPAQAPKTLEPSPAPNPSSEAARPGILIESVPDGAEVFLNGTAAGKTPFFFVLPWSVGQAYSLKVSKPGYYEVFQQLVITPGIYKTKFELVPGR